MDKIYLDQAMELVKAQASVKSMTADEMISMRNELAAKLSGETNEEPEVVEEAKPFCDPKKAITEKHVICLVCGQRFTVLTAKHLATHGMTPEEYRTKFGYKKGAPLASKALSKMRREKMASMKLWEKRGRAKPEAKPGKTRKIVQTEAAQA